MARAFFKIYFSSRRVLMDMLDDTQRGRVVAAAFDYAQHQTEPDGLCTEEQFAFEQLRVWIDYGIKTYDNVCERNRANGSKGGRPRKDAASADDKNPVGFPLIKAKAKAKAKAKDKAKAKAKEGEEEESIENDDGSLSLPLRFAPPTVDQVADYCAGRSNGIDAQHFIDYYEARGWMIGNQHMRSWQAAIRNWENRDAQQNRNTIDSQFDRVLGAAISDEEDGDDDDKA